MKTRFVQFLATVIVGVLAAAALNGCGGSDGTIGSGGTGTLRVNLADGSDPLITRVDVNISEVSANIDGHWQVVSNTPQSYNLLDLVVDPAVIGTKVLPSGNYSQIRLKVDSGTITDADGTHDLVIPSGSQSGIKINVDFPIDQNNVTDILLDFSVAHSIVRQGNGTYLLKPVIPAVVMVRSGTATGVISDVDGVVQGAVVEATYVAGDEYPLNTIVNSTSTMADGSFKMWALLPGTYDFTVTFTNPSTLTEETATISGVTITANQNTDLGPITIQ